MVSVRAIFMAVLMAVLALVLQGCSDSTEDVTPGGNITEGAETTTEAMEGNETVAETTTEEATTTEATETNTSNATLLL